MSGTNGACQRVVHLLGKKLALVKHQDFGAGGVRGLNKLAVIGVLIAIPIDHGHGVQLPGVTVKNNHSHFFQVDLDLGLKNVQIRFHCGAVAD